MSRKTIIADAVGTDTGTLDLPGNVVIGNASTDTVVVNAEVASDVVPDGGGRTLGSSANRWLAVETAAVHTPHSDTFAGTFTHTLSDGASADTIEVATYDAPIYVGGTLTLWMGVATDLTNNYGTAEYVLASHDNGGGSSSANIDKIGGAQAFEGVTPIGPGCSASIVVGAPNRVSLRIENTVDAVAFPTGTQFTGKWYLTLLKAV